MTTGLLLVLLAGLFQGSFLLPSKWLRDWKWENYWLLFAMSAYLLCPWLLAVATVPNLWSLYQSLDASIAIPVVLFGLGWGLGAVTFGLGIEALGLALGFAVIVGVATIAGTLLPMLLLPSETLSGTQIAWTAISLLLVLVGVVICSMAGNWKQQQATQERKASYSLGLLIAVASGLLSSCGSLGFAWGEALYKPILDDPMQAPYFASNALLPILTPPLFLCNAGCAIYFLQRNRTWGLYKNSHAWGNAGWCLLMGVLWLAGMALFGIGKDRMGDLGGSLGWAMMMSSMILSANGWGLLSGEWKAAPVSHRRLLGIGLVVLVAAVCLLGYTNSLSQGPGETSGASSALSGEARDV